MHKILGFEEYQVAPRSASRHVVDVVDETHKKVVAQGISLEELYDKHVKPGHMLYLTHKMSKGMAENVKRMREEQVAQEKNKFAIVRPHSRWVALDKGFEGKQLGALKSIHIALANPVAHVKLVLDRAYQFVANGSPVEFQIRLKGSYAWKGRKKLREKEKDMDMDKETGGEQSVVQEEEDGWVWLHEHFPHLRPDFILKSMPEGAVFLIDPVRDEVQMKFVVALKAAVMPTMDLNERVKRVKAAVWEGKKEKARESRARRGS
jgi:hypothetical protein